jgi:hypothetical protein
LFGGRTKEDDGMKLLLKTYTERAAINKEYEDMLGDFAKSKRCGACRKRKVNIE